MSDNINKKERKFSYPKYREFADLAQVSDWLEAPPVKVDISERVEKFGDIFDAIFVLDPVTGFPIGDISQFMSDKTSPQIAQFIKTQLMQPNVAVGSASADKGLSDDDLIRFERKGGENVRDYVERINGYIIDDIRARHSSNSLKKE